MKSWARNQMTWHIFPVIHVIHSWLSKKRVRSQIRGVQNRVGFCHTTDKSSVVIKGDKNSIVCDAGVVLGAINIRIIGNRSVVKFGFRSRIDSLSLFIEGDNCLLEIGDMTFISEATMIIDEDGTEIRVGEGCMFANGIEIRTGDCHGIFDSVTRERLNPGASVLFGNRVWLGSGVKVLKGSTVADGCIVGTGSIVTKPLGPCSSLFVGSPARFVRGGVTWGWHRDRFPEPLPVKTIREALEP